MTYMLPPKKKKGVPEPSLTEIIRAVVFEELSKRFARCHDAECGKFFNPRYTNIAGCRCCTYLASYCDEHGGFDRACRGATAHVRWFASKRAVARFGHFHLPYWQAYRARPFRKLKAVP